MASMDEMLQQMSAPDQQELDRSWIGTILDDRYEIKELIGEGGMATVYSAVHIHTKKQVAVKLLHRYLAQRSEQRKRFQIEAQAVCKLHHPGIIAVHDFGISQGQPYFVMDLFEGKSLADKLKGGQLSLEEALPLFMQICDAMEHAHNQGLIHRDLKPSNLVILEGPDSCEVKVLDFGLCKTVDQDQSRITETGMIVGTAEYMSPEQCLGGNTDKRTDVYAMGCIMFEVLIGCRPFSGPNTEQVLMSHVHVAVPSMASLRTKYAARESVELVVLKALSKKIEDRYASMAELKADLARLAVQECGSKRAKASLGTKLRLLVTRLLGMRKGKAFVFSFVITALLLICLIQAVQSWLMPLADLQGEIPLNAALFKFKWAEPKVQEQDSEFERKVTLATMALHRAEQGIDWNDVALRSRRRKLADFLMRHGLWDKALDLLQSIENSLRNKDEMNTYEGMSVNTAIGDCFAYRGLRNNEKDREQAERFYRRASTLCTEMGGSTIYTTQDEMAKLKLATLELQSCQLHEALADFKAVYGDSAMKQAGIADCFFLRAIYMKPGDKRREILISDAREAYNKALSLCNPDTPGSNPDYYDPAVIQLRIADTYIFQKNYKEALPFFNGSYCLRKAWSDFSNTQKTAIANTHARLLWFNNDWVAAWSLNARIRSATPLEP
jgi:tRNA A-37 threonylcarbamoyl transferase component Bud32/tetratricopeptide (TPR) repeat protein